MTAQTPEPTTTAPVKTFTPEPATDAPLTFQAPPPETPGAPNPIPRSLPFDQPITPTTAAEQE